MRNNILTLFILGLIIFLMYISAVTNIPYILYFFIISFALFFITVYLINQNRRNKEEIRNALNLKLRKESDFKKLKEIELEKRKNLQDIELEKNLKQEEWNKLSKIKRQKIFNELSNKIKQISIDTDRINNANDIIKQLIGLIVREKKGYPVMYRNGHNEHMFISRASDVETQIIWESISEEEKNIYIYEYKNRENKEKAKSKRLEKERKIKQDIVDKDKDEFKQKQIIKENIAKEILIEKIKNENEENIIKRKKEKEFKIETELKESIKSKILETERKKRLESEAIQELIDAGLIDINHYSGKNIRESIPRGVKIAVWHRDKERCVDCNSNTDLEFDHIIPVSKGGANTTKNIQLLCKNCNRSKGSKIM